MYSAIMASRPREAYILDALASIFAQTLPPERVIVVVNGLGAANAEMRSMIPEAFPRAEVHDLPTPNLAGALAYALESITTPFVGFLDADDLWEPEKQERQVRLLNSDASLDAVACEVVNFCRRPDGTEVDGLAVDGRLFAAVTFRTDAFTRFGMPDGDAGHFAWLFRWWARAQAAGISTATVDYRGLRRRVHDANSWVVDREHGRSLLLSELRRITRERRSNMDIRDAV